MALLTKAEARSMIRAMMSDESSEKWNAGNLDLLIQLTLDRLWAKIIDIAPMLYSYLDTVTTLTSPGYISTGLGGDLTKRFVRLQSLTRDGREYHPISRKDVVFEDSAVIAVNVSRYYKYVVMGSQIHLLPYDTAADVEIRYSYRPDSFTTLADTATVEWPDGHEDAYIAEIVLRAATKLPPEFYNELKDAAKAAWFALEDGLGELLITPQTTDDASAWGGE